MADNKADNKKVDKLLKDLRAELNKGTVDASFLDALKAFLTGVYDMVTLQFGKHAPRRNVQQVVANPPENK